MHLSKIYVSKLIRSIKSLAWIIELLKLSKMIPWDYFEKECHAGINPLLLHHYHSLVNFFSYHQIKVAKIRYSRIIIRLIIIMIN